MNQRLKAKINESLSSVLPITGIVLLLSFTVAPMPIGTLMLFLSGAALLIIGMGFFSLGVDMAMLPLGEGIGTQITKTRRIFVAIIACFVIGAVITIAEPDLQVLAKQVPSVPDMVLILTVAVGVGLFLIAALLRIFLKIRLSHLLIIFYALTFILAQFAPPEFIAVAFDSGGVTTGPITVPFIMALGIGIASLRSDKDSHDDSFGLIALCSIGPILSVIILSLFYDTGSIDFGSMDLPVIETTRDIAAQFAQGLPAYLKEVLTALAPIVIMAILLQLISRRFPKRKLLKMAIGMAYTYIGLVTFLTGVNVGFMPAGQLIGSIMAGSAYRWVLVPLGAVIGYFIVSAEPAVHVLKQQVEEISGGAISQGALQRSLSIGVACAVGLSMLRVLTGISIYWFLAPGYMLALGMTFFSPKLFTAIAFDSGGVASGPMTATFLLPLAMGACRSVGGNMMMDAFGIVAMVAMTPLITIQALGCVYAARLKAKSRQPAVNVDELADTIIYYGEEAYLSE